MTYSGIGYDLHRLVEGRKLMIGGVEVPFEKGSEGHSDGDVLSHALCDALLGAAALGDIGKHFPDTDMQYRNVDSRSLLRMVYAKVGLLGWKIANADMTIVAQAPRMATYISRMVETIAADLQSEV